MTVVELAVGNGADRAEWAVAELMARAGLEPALAARFAADPGAVCAEFGLIGPGQPEGLAAAMAAPASVERLDRVDGTARWCPWCICTVTTGET